ncbi:type IV secretory system conjugative DNA transfer family protein, partial [Staphylococcus aureus]|uniref:type IV secretory system conjugative DNA transfer family protein n=2 Tax=Bacteria TaxID=2 RepID=UPI003D25E6EB
EQKDANAYSEMLGTRTERSRTTSRSNGMFGARGGATESFSDQRRALMLPQEIKELDRDKEIILLENTKPILADRICYWRDRAFTSRVMDAPAVPALDLVRFSAQIEQRLRELSDDDVDEQTGELTHVRADYLELVHAWD